MLARKEVEKSFLVHEHPRPEPASGQDTLRVNGNADAYAQRLRTIGLQVDPSLRLYDVLPLCRRLRVPLVYDVHHPRCRADGLTVEEATALAAELTGDKTCWSAARAAA